MKIIFTDFDGVLRPACADHLAFNENAVLFLNALCATSDARIVCTSTYAGQECPSHKEKAFRLFHEAGLDTAFIHENWSSFRGIEEYYTSRGQSIRLWLDAHPEIAAGDFVIIDDEDHGLSEIGNFIQTHPQGLQPERDFARIAALLSLECKKGAITYCASPSRLEI